MAIAESIGRGAYADKTRNVWNGELRGIGRKRLAFNNSDKYPNFWATKFGYESFRNVSRYENEISKFSDRVFYGPKNAYSQSMKYRINNSIYTYNRTVSVDVSRFIGTSELSYNGYFDWGCNVEISFDGNIVQTLNQGQWAPSTIRIPADVKTITISIVGEQEMLNFGGMTSYFETRIYGYLNYP